MTGLLLFCPFLSMDIFAHSPGASTAPSPSSSRCQSTRTARRLYLRVRTWVHQQLSFTPTRFDEGIFPTPHFSARLPSPSSLRHSGSSPTSSGPPQQASSTPISRSSPSTLWTHPLSFSSLPSPQLSSSSPHQPPVLASLAFPSPLLSSLPALLASHHSLFFRLRQVALAQCFCAMSFLS